MTYGILWHQLSHILAKAGTSSFVPETRGNKGSEKLRPFFTFLSISWDSFFSASSSFPVLGTIFAASLRVSFFPFLLHFGKENALVKLADDLSANLPWGWLTTVEGYGYPMVFLVIGSQSNLPSPTGPDFLFWLTTLWSFVFLDPFELMESSNFLECDPKTLLAKMLSSAVCRCRCNLLQRLKLRWTVRRNLNFWGRFDDILRSQLT